MRYFCSIYCDIIQSLWNYLALFFESDFTLFCKTLQAAFIGLLNSNSKLILIHNHLLLIFEKYVYNFRRSESLILKSLIREITKVKSIEEKFSINNVFKKIWEQVVNILKNKFISHFA